VVLLFAAEGGWNLNGGVKLLKERPNLDTYILFISDDIDRYSFSKGGVEKYDSVTDEASIELLRWKP